MAQFLFPTSLTPSTITVTDQLLTLALGKTTIVNLTSTGAKTVAGLAATGGNLDGMVVCFSNINTANDTISFTHDAAGLSPSTNRFLSAATGTLTVPRYGAAWFRYSTSLGGWLSFAKITGF